MTYKGLKDVKSPSRIGNREHHDSSAAGKEIGGSPTRIKLVVPTSTTATPVNDFEVVRAANTTGAWEYVWIGKESEVPGTIDITTALAIAPNSVENLFAHYSDDCKESLVVVASAAAVQLVIME